LQLLAICAPTPQLRALNTEHLHREVALGDGYNYDSTAIRPRDVYSTSTCARVLLPCGLNR